MRWLTAVAAAFVLVPALSGQAPPPLDRDAQRWVDTTFAKLSIDEKLGQLIMPGLNSTYLPTDSAAFEELSRLLHDTRAGGFVAFGGTEPVPDVLLNASYGAVILGQPLELASLLNRLQAIAPLPLLNSADFEWGAGMRVAGATRFPRAMALGAAGDEQLTFEMARITAVEGRALGVHVNFAPVADVNNNPRNPVISIRSFGEDPARVGAMVAAYTRGLQQGGMQATIKHFPGHGDTGVDSHLGLPIIEHPRSRLDAVELPPFRAGIAAGAIGAMVAHVELPALDPAKGPATLSRPVVTGLLRGELGFNGLIYTDAMNMNAVADTVAPGDAAVRAVQAGADVILVSPDSRAAVEGLKAAAADGRLDRAAIDASVRRILTAKARAGLHRTRSVTLDAVAAQVGGRQHQAVAQAISERSVTLLKDEGNRVPLGLPPGSNVLYLSVLDYPSGWRIAAPSRAIIPALKARWPSTVSVEVSDRSTPNELELVRAMAGRYDAIVAGVFVRVASASGRMDLAPAVTRLLQDLARASGRRSQPMVTVFFGNPYTPMFLPELPAMLLTYDFSDTAEESAVRALAGEIPIRGKLPVALPGLFPVGHGLMRGGPGGATPR